MYDLSTLSELIRFARLEAGSKAASARAPARAALRVAVRISRWGSCILPQ
jgi:hypothetical protein